MRPGFGQIFRKVISLCYRSVETATACAFEKLLKTIPQVYHCESHLLAGVFESRRWLCKHEFISHHDRRFERTGHVHTADRDI